MGLIPGHMSSHPRAPHVIHSEGAVGRVRLVAESRLHDASPKTYMIYKHYITIILNINIIIVLMLP